MDWASGYMQEIEYTHGYYGEQSPVHLAFVLTLAGFEPPPPKATYLEVGFGQGLTSNIHAAATQADIWGTDVNSAHAANARALAGAAGLDVKYFDLGVEELALRDDLPEFDYITLHGLWAWVSKDVRDGICELIRRRLKVGGAVYISYNTLPGWASALPMRHMMAMYAELAAPAAAGILERASQSLEFLSRLEQVGARYVTDNPAIPGRLKALRNMNQSYVAHEYFNAYWNPMYFSEVAKDLAEAKLNFAGSAAILDYAPGLHLSEAQLALLNSIAQPALRETVRDYLLNAQFRRDVFVRGGRRLNPVERNDRLGAFRVVLTSTPEQALGPIVTALGELSLKREIYEPVLEALQDGDAGPKTIGSIAAALEAKGLPRASTLEAVMVLAGGGRAAICPAEDPTEVMIERSRKLTGAIIKRAHVSGEMVYLPSPLTGAGVVVNRFEQLFLESRRIGGAGPEEWAQHAWATLKAAEQRLVAEREGAAVVLESDEDNLAELTKQANAFAERLPSLLRVLVE